MEQRPTKYQLTNVEGVVSRVSPYGFQLQGREGWLNISKFVEPKPELPRFGAKIKVGLNNAGFVCTITTAGSAQRTEREPPPPEPEPGGLEEIDW